MADSLGELAHLLLPVAHRAGGSIMAYFQRSYAIGQKPDGSPITPADTEAARVLLDGLTRIAPRVPVLCEESGEVGGWVDGDFFLIDPLDGTREFIANRPEFTVNIALVRSGQPVFGIVYAPATGEIYVTTGTDSAAKGSISADAEFDLEELVLNRIEVRPTAIEGPLVICASRSHRSERLEAFLQAYPDAETMAAGSSLKFCMVADGRADLYPRLGPTHEWDTAAGDAIVRAAGGRVTTFDGNDLTYGKRNEGFINPDFLAFGPRYAPTWDEL